MIIDLLLIVLQGVVEILLLPLTAINIGVDFIASIPVIGEFLQVIAYILPWSNLLPLIILTVALFGLRIAIALVKTIWDLLPIL